MMPTAAFSVAVQAYKRFFSLCVSVHVVNLIPHTQVGQQTYLWDSLLWVNDVYC